MAIYREGDNQQIENFKAALGLKGDVYMDDRNRIANLESHRALLQAYGYPTTAVDIEEAEVERAAFEAWLAERLAAAQAEEGEEETDFPEEIGGE